MASARPGSARVVRALLAVGILGMVGASAAAGTAAPPRLAVTGDHATLLVSLAAAPEEAARTAPSSLGTALAAKGCENCARSGGSSASAAASATAALRERPR